MSFIMFTTRSAIFLTVMSYVLLGNDITAEKVFVITSYYQILRQTMTLYFPQGVAQLAEAHVAISRIQKFMLTEESSVGDPTPLNPYWHDKRFKKNRTLPHIATSEISLDDEVWKYVSLDHVSAKYGDEVCLSNINLELQRGKLTAVIGQVGAGKSCLMNLIMGELTPFEGTISANGVIAYASQEPWLFAGNLFLCRKLILSADIANI